MWPTLHVFKMLNILQMYLALEVLLSLGVEVAAHFSDLAEMSHFTVVDTLRLSLWRADLVLEVNLMTGDPRWVLVEVTLGWS